MNSFYSEEELQQIGFRSVGRNVLLSRKASIYGAGNISIGNDVRIDDFCILSGSITVGNNIHISAYVALFAGKSGIVLKDYVGVSSRCAIYAESDDYTGEAMTNPTIPDKYRAVYGGTVTLEKHVLIGTGSTVLPNVTIGEGTSVGSMSLVTKNLEPWSIYVGCPCVKRRARSKNILKLEREYENSMNK